MVTPTTTGLSVSQVARLAGLSEQRIRQLCDAGQLRSVRVGPGWRLIDRESVILKAAAQGASSGATTNADFGNQPKNNTTNAGVVDFANQLRQRSTDDLLRDLALVRRAPSSLAPLARVRAQLTLDIIVERERRGAA